MVIFIILSFLSLMIVLGASFAGAYCLEAMFGGDLTAWVQSLGAILAIVSGFAAAIWQVRAQRVETQAERSAVARAAHILAYEALETASDRLEAALIPRKSGKVMSLQGDRTTEMVLAMREFDTMKLPADLLPLFVRLRSHVFAINERISEVYSSEERNEERKTERENRLKSAVRVRTDATLLFETLQSMILKFGAQKMNVETGAETARVTASLHQ
ncbi:hypothetical protein ANTHELSMS3_02813 [Antarctobacter heliothermus]|uniref:5-bromo-4-chloroindolyl phosphate hydrolysis protein n=2 Tax=Antarctobacter heliothermus TaxID=74033 RepID=A0A222E633_9RHOB|nr:hypothetical protein ANTHELSMS3_02813 [Antarctobacter heliothermus]